MRKDWKAMADIVTMVQEELKARGAAEAAALAAKAVEGSADGTELIDHEEMVPTWRQRDYSSVSVGTPYKWQGQVYKLWQQHDATGQSDWSPDKAVSLWNICHTTDPRLAKEYTAPQGTRGLWQSGECCILNAHVWRSLAADNAYSPAELPANWEDLGPADEVQV